MVTIGNSGISIVDVNESLDHRIEVATAEARAATAEFGVQSKEAAALWEIVEELHAEAGHRRQKSEGHNSFTDFCDSHPDAAEAKVYEV